MPEKNDFDLGNKIALLTGGAGILGRSMAAALLRNGARVALVDRNVDALAEAAAQLGGASSALKTYECDITDPSAMRALKQAVERDLDAVDILINNAATKSANFFAPFEEFPLEDWHEVMNVNVTGVTIGCQVFGAEMARRGRGSIVNTLSIYGVVAPDQRIYEGSSYEGRSINTPAVYSASKAAVWGLTKYLATYWGPRGVRVNAITPGGVFSGQNDTFVERYSARVPLGRMAERDEMAGAVVFLASDASSYVNGQNIIVDGGLTTW